MNRPDTLSDEDFLRRFLACRLEPAEFDHEGHLRAAWLVLQRHTLADAVEHACAGIAGLAAKFGAPDKYNRTMSEAIIRLMASGQPAGDGASLADFLAGNPEFAGDIRGLLARHYSSERLHSDEARRRFLAPDREALPL